MLVEMPTTMWMTHPSVVMLRLSDGVLRVILVAWNRALESSWTPRSCNKSISHTNRQLPKL